MSRRETILVTGSGGFIGGWIVELFHLNHSADMRAGIRNWSSAARLGRLPVEIVLCDVMDRNNITKAMSGANCVIHCVSGSSDAIIQGTENMLAAALAQDVARFVHVSTTEIYGNVSGIVDESSPYQTTGSPYGDAKAQAESICWEYHKRGVPVTVVRPSIVYGPFSKDWSVGFAQRLLSGNWGIFRGFGEGICNLIYVADLVEGISLAIHKPTAVGQAFNLVGPELLTWNQYFQKFNAALNLQELKMIDPSSAKVRAAVMDPVRSLGKYILKHFTAPLRKLSQNNRQARELLQSADKTLKTSPRISELALYNRKAQYSTRKAREMLGFNPVIDTTRGLDLTVRWLYQMGIVEQSDEGNN